MWTPCASVLLLAAFISVDNCLSASIQQPMDPRLSDDTNPMRFPQKRPFCNAFTGCGRKRSMSPGMPPQELLRQRQYVDDEGSNTLLDSENVLNDYSRQLLNEARLWEALQEASAELTRRKQKEFNFNSNK